MTYLVMLCNKYSNAQHKSFSCQKKMQKVATCKKVIFTAVVKHRPIYNNTNENFGPNTAAE